MRILLIDDDEILIDILQCTLGKKNYAVDAVTNAEQGWLYGTTYTYDLIILDWILPKLDGISLCKRFRSHGYDVPILLLTARNNSQEKIKALDAGADDYLSKPFDVEELAARIRALLRRSNVNFCSVITWGDLQLNSCSCEVTFQGRLIGLTAKEYQLLELFMSHQEEVFSIEDIIESLWSSLEYPSEATIRSHLRHLRRKLKSAGLPENPITTLRGRGYCLKSSPSQKVQNVKMVSESQPAKDVILINCDTDDLVNNNDSSPKRSRSGSTSSRSQHAIALNKAWEKYRDKSKKQLAILEKTLQIWKAGKLDANQLQAAQLNAHKLAGNLGVFGFEEESRLASELEQLLETNFQKTTEKFLKFQKIFDKLHSQLISKKNLSDQSLSLDVKYSPLIFVIDDNKQFTKVFAEKAISKKMRSEILPNLEVARQRVKDAQADQLPNVVLIRLSSTQSEYQNIRQKTLSLIKELNSMIPSIPTIVISDKDSFQDRLIVAQHGGAFYLKQPVSPDEAINFCQQILKSSAYGKKVMIVDDDVDLLKVLPHLLQPWGFKLTTLDDPRQFWDVLQAVQPDLLVLDIKMPYFSGIELCKVLKSHPYWYKLPTLYMSINQYFNNNGQTLIDDADDFVHKPLIAEQLANRILHHLAQKACREANLFEIAINS